jgi:hypothetical protein
LNFKLVPHFFLFLFSAQPFPEKHFHVDHADEQQARNEEVEQFQCDGGVEAKARRPGAGNLEDREQGKD